MEILKHPDPRLTAPNARFGAYGPDEAAKVREMFRLAAEADGVGLAAPQVGWNVRLFVVSVPDRASGEVEMRAVWNPTVATMGERIPMPEGCLSFPGVHASIPRWSRVRLFGTGPEGPVDEVLDGLFAQAAQHEMDHIEGTLIVDRMTPADRLANRAALEALEGRGSPRP